MRTRTHSVNYLGLQHSYHCTYSLDRSSLGPLPSQGKNIRKECASAIILPVEPVNFYGLGVLRRLVSLGALNRILQRSSESDLRSSKKGICREVCGYVAMRFSMTLPKELKKKNVAPRCKSNSQSLAHHWRCTRGSTSYNDFVAWSISLHTHTTCHPHKLPRLHC